MNPTHHTSHSLPTGRALSDACRGRFTASPSEHPLREAARNLTIIQQSAARMPQFSGCFNRMRASLIDSIDGWIRRSGQRPSPGEASPGVIIDQIAAAVTAQEVGGTPTERQAAQARLEALERTWMVLFEHPGGEVMAAGHASATQRLCAV
ncbi:hypothetical protein ACWDUL_20470 [Nocardia niigatensis]